MREAFDINAVLHALIEGPSLDNAPVRGPMIDLRELSEHWGASGQFPVEGALLGIGLLLIVIAVAALVQWRRTRHLRSRPLAMFLTVAREVGLSWSQQLLLIRIARAQRLPGALTLLVCPATLDHHAKQYVEARPGRARSVAAAVDAVRLQAFAPQAGES